MSTKCAQLTQEKKKIDIPCGVMERSVYYGSDSGKRLCKACSGHYRCCWRREEYFKCNTLCNQITVGIKGDTGRCRDNLYIFCIAPLLLVWVLSYLEKFIEKHLPDAVKALFTPFLCILIMVPLTLLIIGPISTGAANGIAAGYNTLVKVAPPVAAAIVGGVWQVIVIFGVHWGVTPMIMANFANQGFDSFQAFQTCAVCAQMTAAFGVFLKARNKETKII